MKNFKFLLGNLKHFKNFLSRMKFFNQEVNFDLGKNIVHTVDFYDRSAIQSEFDDFFSRTVHEMPGDGNCQFHAIGHFVGEDCDDVRHHVCIELDISRDEYTPFVEGNFDVYLDKMKDDFRWGDNITLMAASNAYCLNIVVFSKVKSKNWKQFSLTRTEFLKPKATKTAYLYFHDYHYDILI